MSSGLYFAYKKSYIVVKSIFISKQTTLRMRPDLSPTKASQSQKDKQSHQEADREKKN